MKTLSAFCMITLTVFAVSAKAETKTYSADAVEILNAVSNCPTEFVAMNKLGYVANATHETAEDSDTYTIFFAAGGRAPSFSRYAIGSLSITRTFQPAPNPLPADYGGAAVYTCTVKTVR